MSVGIRNRKIETEYGQMNCNDLKNGIKSLEDVQIKYHKGIDKAFSKGADLLRKLPHSDKYLIATKEQEKVADMISSFNNAQANIYKSSSDIAKYLHTLSKDESKALVRALNGDIMPENLQGETKELYKRFRAVIDSNAQKLVDAGLLRADYKKEDYLKRFYEKYQDDLVWSDKLFGKARNLSKVYKRKDLDLDTRVALGMIEDSSFVISRTIADQRLQLIKGEFLKSVDRMYGKDTRLDGYVQVPDEIIGGGLKKYGALSGRYVPKDVVDILKGANALRAELGVLEKHWYPIIDHIKVNVTVKNPGTHLYNGVSNVELMMLSHTSPLPLIRASKNQGFSEVVKLGEKYGLIDDTNLAHNLGEILQKLPTVEKKNMFSNLLQELYLGANSNLGRGARLAYNWEDKIFKLFAMQDNIYKMKLAKFEQQHGRLALNQEINNYKAIDAIKLSKDEEYKAFKEANELFIDYQKPLPPMLDKLNRYVVPFANYGFKSTPVVIREMIKHPLTAMSLNFAGGGVVGRVALLGASYAGASNVYEWLKDFVDTNDDKEAYYQWMKPTIAGARIPYDNIMLTPGWRKVLSDENNVWYFNQGRMLQGLRSDIIDSIKSFGLPGQMIGNAAGYDLKAGRNFDYETSASGHIKARIMKTIQDFLPAIWTNIPAKFYDAFMYGENLYGEPLSKADVLWQQLGFRRVDKKRAEAMKSKEIQAKINKVQNVDKRLGAVKSAVNKHLKGEVRGAKTPRMALKQIRKIRNEFEDGLIDLDKLSKQAENIEAWSEYKSFKNTNPKANVNRHMQMLDSYEQYYKDMAKAEQLIEF